MSNVSIAEWLVGRLLDKYEKSAAYTRQTSTPRRILLKVPGGLQGIDMDDYVTREELFETLPLLKKQGVLDYNWVKYEEGNLLKEIWLNLDGLDAAYAMVGRRRKIDAVNRVQEVMEGYDFVHYDWMASFKADVIERLGTYKTHTPFLPNDEALAIDIIRTLVHLDGLRGEMVLERRLSVELFSDSKYFGKNIRTRLIGIVRKYGCNQATVEYGHDPFSRDFSEDELLAMVGVQKHAEMIEFCGDIILEMEDESLIDAGAFKHGMVINSNTAKALRGIYSEKINRVLFIENKTCYESLIHECTVHEFELSYGDTLYIYHGGFYSPVKKQFFAMILRSLGESILCEHWSDIDLGGFLIFNRLKREIFNGLKPYRMGVDDLMAFENSWQTFDVDSDYGKRLASLLEDTNFRDFHPVIQTMLEHGCRLEQEAMV